jgi:hypothetical protein
MPTRPEGSRISPNRVVAVLTPLVFAPLAGAIAAGVAKYGIEVDDGQLQAIFIAGATIALAKSAQWTKGWQAFEQRREAGVADPMALTDEEDLLSGADDDEPETIASAFVEDDLDDRFDAEAAELLAPEGS